MIPEPSPLMEQVGPSEVRPRRLLVADDEPEFCDILQEILEERGFEVDVAHNGVEALEQMEKAGEENGYVVLIADINMPEMNGIELIRRSLASFPFTVPVIITGYPDTKAAVESLRVGAYDFISKPFKLDTIYLVIGRALEKHDFLMEKEQYQRRLESEVAQRTSDLLKLNEQLLSLRELARETRETLDLSGRVERIRSFCMDVLKAHTFCFMPFNEELDQFEFHPGFAEPDEPVIKNVPWDELVLQSNGMVSGHLDLYGDRKNEVATVLRRDRVYGLLYLVFENEASPKPDENLYNLLISELEILLHQDRLIKGHQEEMRKMLLSSVRAHAHTIEAKDAYTKGHCERVERITMLLARKLIDDPDRLFSLSVACILHDIGKIGVPESILNKPEKLTVPEKEIMKQHPVIGSEIVRQLYGFELEAVIRHHHEWYDGTGYPDGLKGESIPLESRIISVADTYDAITTSRPYRHGRTPEDALNEIQSYSGLQFDPNIVQVFHDSFDEILAVDRKWSDSGQESTDI